MNNKLLEKIILEEPEEDVLLDTSLEDTLPEVELEDEISIETDTNEVDDLGCQFMIKDAISSQWNKIDDLKSMIVNIKEYPEVVEILNTIIDESTIHLGMLNKALELCGAEDSSDLMKQGEEKATDIISDDKSTKVEEALNTTKETINSIYTTLKNKFTNYDCEIKKGKYEWYFEDEPAEEIEPITNHDIKYKEVDYATYEVPCVNLVFYKNLDTVKYEFECSIFIDLYGNINIDGFTETKFSKNKRGEFDDGYETDIDIEYRAETNLEEIINYLEKILKKRKYTK